MIDAGIATPAMLPKRDRKSRTQDRSPLPRKHCWYVLREKPGIFIVQRYVNEKSWNELREERSEEYREEEQETHKERKRVCLDRLNTLCELYQESHGGEKIRAVAEWIGVADVLPSKKIPLDEPSGLKIFRQHLLATINRECHDLQDAIKKTNPRYLPLSLVIDVIAMLAGLVGSKSPDKKLERYTDEIEEKHSIILDEIYMELPDPEDLDDVHDTLAALMWKYSKKALNGHRLIVPA